MHVNFDPDDCGFSPFSPSILFGAISLVRRGATTTANGKLLARRDCPRFLAAGDFASVDRARDLSAAHAARKAP
jgi:hypothetical protein